MNQTELAALVGVVVSLAFSYFPVINEWFDQQEPNVKRLLQVAVAAVVAAGALALSCVGVVESFACDAAGALAAGRLLLTFLIANQTAYAVTPK